MQRNEKRTTSRIHLDGPITVFTEEQKQFPCRLRDISMTGISFVGSTDLEIGNSCRLESELMSCGHPFHINIGSQLVRRGIRIHGIRFLAMTRETLQQLQTLLLYNSFDPIVLGEEFARESPAHLFSDHKTFPYSPSEAFLS